MFMYGYNVGAGLINFLYFFDGLISSIFGQTVEWMRLMKDEMYVNLFFFLIRTRQFFFAVCLFQSFPSFT